MENEINLIWNQVRKSLTCLNGQQVDLVGHVLKFLAKFLDVALDAGGQQAHVVGHRVDGLRSRCVQLDLSSLHITPLQDGTSLEFWNGRPRTDPGWQVLPRRAVSHNVVTLWTSKQHCVNPLVVACCARGRTHVHACEVPPSLQFNFPLTTTLIKRAGFQVLHAL